MGGSKSKSKSSTSTSTSTKTSNLALDGVEGVTVVSGIESSTINVTDGGAFDVVAKALDTLEASQAKALTTVGDTTVRSLEKINQSNQTEAVQRSGQYMQFGIFAAAAYAAARIWGKK